MQIVRINRKFYAALMGEGGDILEHITYMTSLAARAIKGNEKINFIKEICHSHSGKFTRVIQYLSHKFEC